MFKFQTLVYSLLRPLDVDYTFKASPNADFVVVVVVVVLFQTSSLVY